MIGLDKYAIATPQSISFYQIYSVNKLHKVANFLLEAINKSLTCSLGITPVVAALYVHHWYAKSVFLVLW